MIDRPKSEHEDGKSGDDPTGKKHSVSVAIQSLAEQQKAGSKRSNEQHGENIKWTRRTFWAVVWYSILTMIIAGASVYSARESREAIRQAANAATAASRQASIAEDTEKRQLRAYVATVPGDIENFGDMAKQRFVLTVRNFGETPAYNVGSQFSCSDVYKPEGSIGVVEAERPCGQP